MVSGELDSLPEEINWRDEGCEVFGSCLNCPLPRCVEEELRGQQRLRLAVRNRRMAELRRSGKSVKYIAGLFGVSRRTVERALKNQNAKVKMTETLENVIASVAPTF
jgi:DNA-binding CsgD family transcriptional regulator